jgi:hypothetical protein
MIDLRGTIKPKSDQLNADDLIGGPVTIRITGVVVGEGEQPVSISFDGDGGKPFKPGKSMRRVLVNLWGPDGAAYIGRSLTIYRDEQVVFGGVEVGGIRISHMSHLQRETTMALTATKAKRKPFTVRPLIVEKPAAPPAPPAEAPLLLIGPDAKEYSFKGVEAWLAAAKRAIGKIEPDALGAWRDANAVHMDAAAERFPDVPVFETIIAAIDHRREYAETQTQEPAE